MDTLQARDDASRIAKFEQEVEKLKLRLQQKNDTITTLSSQNVNIANRYADDFKELATVKQQNISLEAQREKSEAKRQASQAEARAASEKLEAAVRSNNILETRCTEFEAKISDAQCRADTANEKLEAATIEIVALKEKAQQLEHSNGAPKIQDGVVAICERHDPPSQEEEKSCKRPRLTQPDTDEQQARDAWIEASYRLQNELNSILECLTFLPVRSGESLMALIDVARLILCAHPDKQLSSLLNAFVNASDSLGDLWYCLDALTEKE